MKSLQRIQRGFTLIELLIVIAVIGVLATVVLVAIDPVQQLARGRDAGRITTVAQLGHAMQSYVTAQNLSTPPAVSNTWQTTLNTAGEISSTYTAPAGAPASGPAADCQGSYCYAPSGTAFVIWTFLEAKSNIDKAAGPAATACAAGQAAAAVYDSGAGKGGVGCVSTSSAPATGITLY